MNLSRSAALLASFLTVGSLALSRGASAKQMEFKLEPDRVYHCPEPLSQILPPIFQLVQKASAVPDEMKDQIFWGQRAQIPTENSYDERLSVSALNMQQQFLLPNPILWVSRIQLSLGCDSNLGYAINITNELNESQLATARLIDKEIAAFQTESAGLPYDQKLELIIRTMEASFRYALYQPHTDWIGAPKSTIQLMTEKVGDCKDFAFARALTAVALGAKPEHVMVVFYLPRGPGNMGHANVAFYHPVRKSWIFVENNGRSSAEQEGESFVYENDPRIMKGLAKTSLGNAAPFLAVTAAGKMMAFNSFRIEQGSRKITLAREPMPVPDRNFLFETFPSVAASKSRSAVTPR